ncbi:MAG: hypothetical protein R3C49_16985 [Planctomycetaceae bacterium]
MSRFRYEAVDAAGVPLHGSLEAASTDELQQTLARRGLRLVSSSEQSLNSLVSAHRETLPRLYQLRIGEHLREAILTGLPGHEAVRAVASEPIAHPLLGLIPWLEGVALLLLAGAVLVRLVTGQHDAVVVGGVVLATVIVPAAWYALKQIFEVRPRQLLHRIADRLEAGEPFNATLQSMMPREVRSVMRANISNELKGRVAADLVPSLLGGNTRAHRFAYVAIGPFIMLGLILSTLHIGAITIIPQFKSIFESFGVSLPGLTLAFISLSDIASILGIGGWLTMAAVSLAALILISLALSTGLGGRLLERIPVIGLVFRWTMQARVARILASMVRHGSSYDEAIRTSTDGSGFPDVSEAGAMIADQMLQGRVTGTHHRLLSGLPISMLTVPEVSGNAAEERRSGIVRTFESLADMLESGTESQGRLFATVMQMAVLTFCGFVVGLIVIALFLPLIKLLNDLS